MHSIIPRLAVHSIHCSKLFQDILNHPPEHSESPNVHSSEVGDRKGGRALGPSISDRKPMSVHSDANRAKPRIQGEEVKVNT